MRFNFIDINLSDEDYLNYNIFHMLKSRYGKKQMVKYRLIISLFFIALAFISLWGGGFSLNAVMGIIPYFIVFAVIQLALNSIFVHTIKAQLKSLKKQGKMGYSAKSTIEFHDNELFEISADSKTEQKYSAIERISILNGNAIYIHVNNVMAYILPLSCFESEEQYNAFFEFIKTKCANIDIY